MLYCIKCGDPIEKDELICDKCGYHFTIVEGSPAKVYMDQTPKTSVTSSAQSNVQGWPMQSGSQSLQGRPIYSNMQSSQGRPMQSSQGRPVQPNMQGRPSQSNMQSMQGRPMQPNMQGRPMQPNMQYGQRRPMPAAGMQQKPKKKKKGWLIALCSIGGAVAMLILCSIVFAGAFLITGGVLLDTGDDIVVNEYNPDSDTTTVAQSNPVVYDGTDSVQEPEPMVSGAIREPFVTLKGNNQDKVTIMLYMNGSNLESDNGMATMDIREILSATISDNVRIIIQTGGTRRWKTEAIASDHSQRFLVESGALTLIDDSLGQLDVTDPDTLEDFITYCNTNYPANRNMLIFWNHGSGAVYGFGYDEHVDDYYAALTLDEIQTAIRNTGVKFEMIGFDACLMGGLETACALSDSADYLIASEDFESGRGWEYQNWLTVLGTNSSTPMEDLAKIIIDDFVKESHSYGSDGILALIDLRYTRLLFQAWIDFAYSAKDDLLECNYSMEMNRTDRASYRFDTPFERILRDPWEAMFDNNESILEEYNYAVDLMALADTLDTEEAEALEAALSMALVYCSATHGDSEMTGLSITLPYNDSGFYEEMETVYTNCGFDADYIAFLESFVDADISEHYDWAESEWGGWEDYEEEEYDWEEWDQWEEYQENDFGWDEYDYTTQWEEWYN